MGEGRGLPAGAVNRMRGNARVPGYSQYLKALPIPPQPLEGDIASSIRIAVAPEDPRVASCSPPSPVCPPCSLVPLASLCLVETFWLETFWLVETCPFKDALSSCAGPYVYPVFSLYACASLKYVRYKDIGACALPQLGCTHASPGPRALLPSVCRNSLPTWAPCARDSRLTVHFQFFHQ